MDHWEWLEECRAESYGTTWNDRIIDVIYQKGAKAARDYSTPPEPPYKRRDYRQIWQRGFDDAKRQESKA